MTRPMLDALGTVLIANRGEIADRIIRTCKENNVKSVAIFSKEDTGSLHVFDADEPVLIPGTGSAAYLDSDEIIAVAKRTGSKAVIPGYGFLSENADFAKKLEDNGLIFVGPSSESINLFGLKHSARKLATDAGVPIVPGSDLIESEDEAAIVAKKIGYPVILKATAGGGGMGLKVCRNEADLRVSITEVRSRGSTLFKNNGVFLEKYVESGRHIEVQVFGNGAGDVVAYGERECSIQRRHQKVVEEAPSPFIELPNYGQSTLRKKLCESAVALASSIKYKSAGTVEFLVDDTTGSFYFLEMNTRLQVEHGITELCYGVDLVYLMLLQARYELSGQVGIPATILKDYGNYSSTSDNVPIPYGHSIEVRVYAENPVKDFIPAPGVLHHVYFPDHVSVSNSKVRVDHWVSDGTNVSPYFDPLLAKVMVWAETRSLAIESMIQTLSLTKIQGPPTNLDYLLQIVADPNFGKGNTLTNFLQKSFIYKPKILEFVTPGAYTTIQDLPGRIHCNGGIPVGGPMDAMAASIANILVGNSRNMECLEVTFSGPLLIFHSPATISLCGSKFSFQVDKKDAPMWTSIYIPAGTEVAIGDAGDSGARAYLAIQGGLPGVAPYLGSKSCSPSLKIGGHQGRVILPGDCLDIVPSKSDAGEGRGFHTIYSLPKKSIPAEYNSVSTEDDPKVWKIRMIPGPHDTPDILSDEGRRIIYETEWNVNHSSNRGALKLDGPKPHFSRETGYDGGGHPSNILEYGYPTGGLSFTGDLTFLFGVDGGTLSGFVCVATPIFPDWWKYGQAKPGHKIKFEPTSWEEALKLRKERKAFLDYVETFPSDNAAVEFKDDSKPAESETVLYSRKAASGLPYTCFRQAGENMILIDFGIESFDLMNTGRQYCIAEKASKIADERVRNAILRAECTSASVAVCFDPEKADRPSVLKALISLEEALPPSSQLKIPSRVFRMPVSFRHKSLDHCIERYIKTQRPHAAYLPDNIKFLMEASAIDTFEQFKDHIVEKPQVVLAVSFFCALPIFLQVDPRLRFKCPKYNPARTFTPAGAIGTGSVGHSIYTVDSPGGYMLWGMTLPNSAWDTFGRLPGFSSDKPWLFDIFDQIVFYEVDENELDEMNKKLLAHQHKMTYTESVFDFSDYAEMMNKVKDEVAVIKKKQTKANARLMERERELLKQWDEEKEAAKESKSGNVTEYLSDPNVIKVCSPMSASVWKIQVNKGDICNAEDVLVILEAMKMEIPVRAPPDKGKIEILEIGVEEGDVLTSGGLLLLAKKV